MRKAGTAFAGRGLAGFAAGALAGVFASRVLPPLMAAASGSARVAAGGDPFDPLIADHRKFLSLLEQMEESSQDARMHRMQLLLRLKRRLAAHAMAEEDVLYPLLSDEAKAKEDVDRLYGDHGRIKILMHRLEQFPKDDPQWVSEVRALKALITEHARQEEEVDFPALASTLDEAARQRLARDLHREKALVL